MRLTTRMTCLFDVNKRHIGFSLKDKLTLQYNITSCRYAQN